MNSGVVSIYNGVLVAEFYTKGDPLTFTAQDHTEFVDAFYRIAQDLGYGCGNPNINHD
jgi:hypothetical protein